MDRWVQDEEIANWRGMMEGVRGMEGETTINGVM